MNEGKNLGFKISHSPPEQSFMRKKKNPLFVVYMDGHLCNWEVDQ